MGYINLTTQVPELEVMESRHNRLQQMSHVSSVILSWFWSDD